MDAVGAAGKETGMDNSRNAVSDGKLYNWNDLVKVGCHDCSGCSACCRDMGQSVLLDPMDVFRLERNLGQSFEQLLAGPAELHVEDGLILPNLKMAGEEPRCFFLNEQGRCAIHAFRPGICRLFPLGRDYEEGRLRYFLLTDACPAKNKSKVKVRKWLDMEGLAEYESFLVRWHGLTKEQRQRLTAQADQEEEAKRLNLSFLQIFYMTPYEGEDFYGEFYRRMEIFANRENSG